MCIGLRLMRGRLVPPSSRCAPLSGLFSPMLASAERTASGSQQEGTDSNTLSKTTRNWLLAVVCSSLISRDLMSRNLLVNPRDSSRASEFMPGRFVSPGQPQTQSWWREAGLSAVPVHSAAEQRASFSAEISLMTGSGLLSSTTCVNS